MGDVSSVFSSPASVGSSHKPPVSRIPNSSQLLLMYCSYVCNQFADGQAVCHYKITGQNKIRRKKLASGVAQALDPCRSEPPLLSPAHTHYPPGRASGDKECRSTSAMSPKVCIFLAVVSSSSA